MSGCEGKTAGHPCHFVGLKPCFSGGFQGKPRGSPAFGNFGGGALVPYGGHLGSILQPSFRVLFFSGSGCKIDSRCPWHGGSPRQATAKSASPELRTPDRRSARAFSGLQRLQELFNVLVPAEMRRRQQPSSPAKPPGSGVDPTHKMGGFPAKWGRNPS